MWERVGDGGWCCDPPSPVPSTRCISTNRQRGCDAAGCHCFSECCITAFMAASLTFLAISRRRRQVRHVAIEQYSTPSIVHIDPACRIYSARDSREPTWKSKLLTGCFFFFLHCAPCQKQTNKHTRATLYVKRVPTRRYIQHGVCVMGF